MRSMIGQARAKCGTSSGGNTSSLDTVNFNIGGGQRGKPHAKTLAIVVGGAFFVSDASELPTFRSCTRVRAREPIESFPFRAPVTLHTAPCLDSSRTLSQPQALPTPRFEFSTGTEHSSLSLKRITARTPEGALEDHVDFLQRQEPDCWCTAHCDGVFGNCSRGTHTDHVTESVLPLLRAQCARFATAEKTRARARKTPAEAPRTSTFWAGIASKSSQSPSTAKSPASPSLSLSEPDSSQSWPPAPSPILRRLTAPSSSSRPASARSLAACSWPDTQWGHSDTLDARSEGKTG